MEKPIRILHVLGRLDRGGAETMVMNLYRNIDRSKIQFDFVVHTKDKCDFDEEVRSLGGEIHFVPQYTGKNHLQYKKSWHDLFNNNKEYKIIHGHVRSTAGIYLRVAKKYGLIAIAHSHNTSSGRGASALIKNSLQYPIRHIADYLFACSKFAGEWLFGKAKCKGENFHLLNNAIESRKFIFDENIRKNKREEFAIENKFVIGHVARFHPQKNHMFLIDVFKEVHKKNEDTVLMLIGKGELQPKVKEKVEKLGLSDSVIFAGLRKDIPELLQAMDLFVFPSLFEGLGIVAVEAQAAGLKCVVADTVPKEAFVTDLIESVSLNDSIEVWSDTIMKNSRYDRRNTQKEIYRQGYDIQKTSQWLERFYLERVV